jgi:glutamate--cysteine ligase
MKCSLPALWAGLLYDEAALAEAAAYVGDWTYAEVDALRPHAWKDGLRATFRGRRLGEVAERIVTIAEGGLRRRARLDAAGRDESVHLSRLHKLASESRTPADLLLDGIEREPDMGKAILERASLKWE